MICAFEQHIFSVKFYQMTEIFLNNYSCTTKSQLTTTVFRAKRIILNTTRSNVTYKYRFRIKLTTDVLTSNWSYIQAMNWNNIE